MPEAQALWLAAALLCSTLGLAWLALALDVHWQQLRDDPPAAPRLLRVLGALALVASLALCLRADHPTMAPLVWVLSLALGALVVAFVLAWRPHWLGPLVAWLPRRRIDP